MLSAVALFVGLPIAATLLAALANIGAISSEAGAILRAALTSLGIAAAAASLSVGAAWSFVVASRHQGWAGDLARRVAGNGAVLLVLPPFVIGAGWFLLLNRFGIAFALAPLAIIMVNAMMSLPFALRILMAAEEALGADLNRLCANLGLNGWTRLRLIDLPRHARAFAFAGALSGALSLGDLGIAALFGSERLVTLPLLLQQRMGSYRQADAAALAGLLASLCLLIFAAADAAARRNEAGAK